MSNEADTCRKWVTPRLQAAGWDNDPHSIAEQRSITDGRVIPVGKGIIRKPPKGVDYLLRYTRDLPLAVVEAKPPRYYQQIAIQRTIEEILGGRKRLSKATSRTTARRPKPHSSSSSSSCGSLCARFGYSADHTKVPFPAVRAGDFAPPQLCGLRLAVEAGRLFARGWVWSTWPGIRGPLPPRGCARVDQSSLDRHFAGSRRHSK